MFDTLDGVNTITDDIKQLIPDLERLDTLMPQLVELLPGQIESMKTMKSMMLTMYQSQKGLQDQMAAQQENSHAMGEAFDDSRNDDSFYLPPEIFNNEDFKRVMDQFISPDGKSVRFIIGHEGDPATLEGISRVMPIKNAAKEAIKGTPLEGSTIYLAGTAATYKDMRDGSQYDLLIAGIAAVTLVFVIMLIITRAIMAATVIVGTVLLSLGASFGLSVLDLAAHHRSRTALDGAADGAHPAAGRRIGLQPAAGVPVEGRDTRGIEDRHHPRDGRHRIRRDLGRPGVRGHDGHLRVQRPEGDGSGGHHHRVGLAVRHPHRAVVHDTCDGVAAGPLVLVASAVPDPGVAAPAASDQPRGPRSLIPATCQLSDPGGVQIRQQVTGVFEHRGRTGLEQLPARDPSAEHADRRKLRSGGRFAVPHGVTDEHRVGRGHRGPAQCHRDDVRFGLRRVHVLR